MDLAAAIKDVVDTLVAAGVRATDDPKAANAPCVLVRPPEIAFRFGKGWDASWTLCAIVPDPGRHQSLVLVSDLITRTQQALGGTATAGRPDDILMPDGAILPMYVLTWTSRINP